MKALSKTITSLLITATLASVLHTEGADAPAPSGLSAIEQKVIREQIEVSDKEVIDAEKAVALSNTQEEKAKANLLLEKHRQWNNELKARLNGLATTPVLALSSAEDVASAAELNAQAWNLIRREIPTKGSAKLALTLTDQAMRSWGDDRQLKARILGTHARALFILGRNDDAIKFAKQAAETNPERVSEKIFHYAGALTDYLKGALPTIDSKSDLRQRVAGDGMEAAAEMKVLIEAKMADVAEQLIPIRVQDISSLEEAKPYAVYLESRDRAAIAAARGNRAQAVALLKQLVPEDEAKPSERAVKWMELAEAMLEVPNLGESRDYQYALNCIENAISAEEGNEDLPLFRMIKARALYGMGRTDECIAVMEQIDKNDQLFDGPANYPFPLEALKAGKPWPKDRLNPDAK